MSTNTDDESFHPLGEEWESELTEMLDDTEYDTDLGLAMAEDAQRLVAGEMTEAEFHEKYHDEVMAEFGEDQRPTAEAYEELEADDGGGLFDALASIDADDDQSRREVLKKMGVGGAAVGVGGLVTADDDVSERASASASSEDDTDGVQWGMTIDLEVCDGCLSCVQACSQENNLDQGVNWMYVLAYEDENVSVPEDAQGTDYPMLVRPCQHCSDAPCEKVCPTTARHTRNKDGIVLTDYDVCIGCRYCQVACPYGVNYFQWDEPDVSQDQIVSRANENEAMKESIGNEEIEFGEPGDHIHDDRGRPVDSRSPRGVMSKCTFCPTRQDGRGGDDKIGTTACMDACPPGAIQFGDVNDPGSDPSVYADHPAFGRAVEMLVETPITIDTSYENRGSQRLLSPTREDVLTALEGESGLSLDEVVEAVEDLTIDLVAQFRAVDVAAEEIDLTDHPDHSRAIVSGVERIREYVTAFEDAGVDFESEEVRQQLRLGEESFDDAMGRLRAEFGEGASSFNLLGDIGTNPNVTYIGNEPGPNAHQVEGPTQYADIDYERADGSEVSLVDNRMDVVDEETVRGI
ncbi:4Fe-4S ferredoxin N-terminal domain-containing protein [Halovivax limisalsi]|uniref:4Fe-4S ferredoxin N-terminal domain-containing protein n=1 Tax=Halovivax limisalsi TaxID=1453760 RepID=UPI001FFCC9BC|nr:4Fe-4S ferredoxin N-terminal domain-containing protein [Halovivax limisalsi]